MRLVDADDAVNRFEELKPKGSSLDVRYAYGVSVGLEMAKHVIMSELPTVDAAPVRHGQWIIKDNPGTGWYRVTCSECGEDVTSTIPMIGFFPNCKAIWDYCPYCGARMDGKDGDVNG